MGAVNSSLACVDGLNCCPSAFKKKPKTYYVPQQNTYNRTATLNVSRGSPTDNCPPRLSPLYQIDPQTDGAMWAPHYASSPLSGSRNGSRVISPNSPHAGRLAAPRYRPTPGSSSRASNTPRQYGMAELGQDQYSQAEYNVGVGGGANGGGQNVGPNAGGPNVEILHKNITVDKVAGPDGTSVVQGVTVSLRMRAETPRDVMTSTVEYLEAALKEDEECRNVRATIMEVATTMLGGDNAAEEERAEGRGLCRRRSAPTSAN
eukprot:Selendium_serpulae@DN5853_c4_g6_i1.p1